MTVLVTTNQTGTEKRRLFVIGRYKNPKAFHRAYIPVEYEANQKSWMNRKFTPVLTSFIHPSFFRRGFRQMA